jgi:ADP-ribose pyrophosphatase YjhB (NUDIX family)
MSWLDDAQWAELQRLIPIVVVDVVSLRGPQRDRVGLIRRATPHQGERWNLIGGRIRYGEPVEDAVRRELSDALGDEVQIEDADLARPHCIGQYGPFGRRPFSHDPRKHAVGLTYALALRGTPAPRGEALAFEWFEPTALPARGEWGFEQDLVAEECLRRAGVDCRFAGA